MLSNARDAKVTSNLNNLATRKLVTVADSMRGNLTVVDSNQQVPFSIARIFFLYGVPKDCQRGGHAHREAEQAFIAVSGSFSLEATDGYQTKSFAMNDPTCAIYVPSMVWIRLSDFSSGAVCLVLTNTSYDPAEYIRDWDEFISSIVKHT